jgi:hypothetical protein
VGNNPVAYTDPFGLCENKKDDPKDCRTVTPAEGRTIATEARALVKSHQEGGVTYASPPAGEDTDDCSHFCNTALNTVLQKAGVEGIPYHSTMDFASSPHFVQVSAPRAGDFIWQPRSSGAPGAGHVGVYLGESDSRGRLLGAQMGTSGAKIAPFGAGGWFEGGGQIKYYRPTVPQ